MTTYLVTLPDRYSIAGVEAAINVTFGAVPHSVQSLDVPAGWPTEVWTAFERARSDRIARQVGVTDTRRHEGNTLKHPSTRFVTDHGGTTAPHGDPLYKYGQPVVCKNTFKGVSR